MSFFRAIFDDRDKSVNAAHFLAVLLTVSSIAWVTYLVHKNSLLPDLSGIAYLLGGSGAMNVANKFEDVVAKFKKHPDPVLDTDVPVSDTPLVLKKIDKD
jgi:hypothetical protein